MDTVHSGLLYERDAFMLFVLLSCNIIVILLLVLSLTEPKNVIGTHYGLNK